jgi:von Willebrand factor type A domain
MLVTGFLGLQLLAAAGTAAAPAVELRTITVAASDESGRPVSGLDPHDVALLENGTARDIARIVRDERPLSVLLLVDSSEDLGATLRLHLIDLLGTFVAALPDGTRYAIWKTGDRPTRILDFGTDRAAALPALKRVFPQGGNTMLDALVEASREFGKQQEGVRSVVVAVSGTTLELSSQSRQQVVDQARHNAERFYFLQIDEGSADQEMRLNYGYTFAELARRSGGQHVSILTPMGAAKPLLAFASELPSWYELTYATEAGLKQRKLELQSARPGVRLRWVPSDKERAR